MLLHAARTRAGTLPRPLLRPRLSFQAGWFGSRVRRWRRPLSTALAPPSRARQQGLVDLADRQIGRHRALRGFVHLWLSLFCCTGIVLSSHSAGMAEAPLSAPSFSSTPAKRKRTVAVIYATKGGIGDVGKFAVSLVLEAEKRTSSELKGLVLKPIAMSDETSEGRDIGCDVDVTDSKLQNDVKTALKETRVIKLDAVKGQIQLEEELKGIDSVVACLGNRQPSMARWCSKGMTSVIRAMEKNGIERLVILSSMGIGEDFTPLRNNLFPIRLLWNTMLRTILRSVWRDMREMESRVTASKLDFLIVRPVGLTPEEPPRGEWHLLTSPADDLYGGGAGLSVSVAKKDVARFMLREATMPTFHRTGVTIGQKPAQK